MGLSIYPLLVLVHPGTNCANVISVFSEPLGGEISPPNNNKFKWPAGYFSHFLSPQKQFPPLNYISRKNPECDGACSAWNACACYPLRPSNTYQKECLTICASHVIITFTPYCMYTKLDL